MPSEIQTKGKGTDMNISVSKRKKTAVKKRKLKGDKLQTIELSGDGFTTDEDESSDEYESCEHFKIESAGTHDHVESPKKKLKTCKADSEETQSSTNKSPTSGMKSNRKVRNKKKSKKSSLKSLQVKLNVKSREKFTVKVLLNKDSRKTKSLKKAKKVKEIRKGKEIKVKKTSVTHIAKAIMSEQQDDLTEQYTEPNIVIKTEPYDSVVRKKRGRTEPDIIIITEPNDSVVRKKRVRTEPDIIIKTEPEDSVVRKKRGRKTQIDKSKTTDSDHDSFDKEIKEKGNKQVKTVKKEPGISRKFVGAHVSIQGGLYKSVLEAVSMKAKAFGLFLKSQRQWSCRPLQDSDAERFKETCQTYGFLPEYILPHGSYLMNCGSPDESTLQKSRDALVDELKRCEKLGLKLFNFHPGSTCGKITVEKCLDSIAESINLAHSKTNNVITVIENMSCQGNTVGGHFEELKGIIDKVKDKSRIGVCLDTCHAFAAGFDLSTEEGFTKMMNDFDQIIGFKYLKAMHLNDSKGKVGCHLDRHENIGKGYIGDDGFCRIMKHPKLDDIPMILETPCPTGNIYAKEVKMLYAMCTT